MVLCSCVETETDKQVIGVVEEPSESTQIIEANTDSIFLDEISSSDDTALYKEQLRLKSIQGTLSDCEFAVKNANSDFAKGVYAFHSPETLPVECTYCDVLRIDFNIERYFINDVFSKKYWACYDSTLIVGLKEKYGKNFLQRAREKADSLDRIGNWNSEPSFIGGNNKLKNYLKAVSVRVSSVLKEPTDSAMVVVNFRIGTSGEVTNPKILKGVNKEADSLALGIIGQMPNWKPAYRQGRPTPMSYTLPFKVGKGKTTPANKN